MAGAAVILRISPDDRATRLAAIGRTHRGRPARIRVGSGHAPGRMIAELPLVSLRWQADVRCLGPTPALARGVA
ncbi:MAG TPA: hypothetical protein VM778_13665 [Gemmatimonadota bacterium]|nr:hypothetical protein [Gemmatimonadota bacterium]